MISLIVNELLSTSQQKEKGILANKILNDMPRDKLSKIISEKKAKVDRIYNLYDKQYMNIEKDVINRKTKTYLQERLGEQFYLMRKSYESKFVDNILENYK